MEIFVFFGIAGVALLGNYLASRGRGDEYRGSTTIMSPPGEGNDPWQDEQFHSRSLGPLSRIGEDDGLFHESSSDWTFDSGPDLINDPVYSHLPGNIWYSSHDDTFGLGNTFDTGNIHHHDDSFSNGGMTDHSSMSDHGGFGTGSDPFDND